MQYICPDPRLRKEKGTSPAQSRKHPNWPVAETARDADLNYNRVPFHTSILPLFIGADCQSWVIEKAMQIYWRMWPALALERLDDMRGDLDKLGKKANLGETLRKFGGYTF